MTLPEEGRKRRRKNEVIKCKWCHKKIDVKEAIENGYIQKFHDINVCDCPYCDKQFNY